MLTDQRQVRLYRSYWAWLVAVLASLAACAAAAVVCKVEWMDPRLRQELAAPVRDCVVASVAPKGCSVGGARGTRYTLEIALGAAGRGTSTDPVCWTAKWPVYRVGARVPCFAPDPDGPGAPTLLRPRISRTATSVTVALGSAALALMPLAALLLAMLPGAVYYWPNYTALSRRLSSRRLPPSAPLLGSNNSPLVQ